MHLLKSDALARFRHALCRNQMPSPIFDALCMSRPIFWGFRPVRSIRSVSCHRALEIQCIEHVHLCVQFFTVQLMFFPSAEPNSQCVTLQKSHLPSLDEIIPF